MKTKPSHFLNHPFESVLYKTEAETVAMNIMAILARTGDEFRKLTWEEYEAERLRDGKFSHTESWWFNEVLRYCKSADTAKLFSRDWDDQQPKSKVELPTYCKHCGGVIHLVSGQWDHNDGFLKHPAQPEDN